MVSSHPHQQAPIAIYDSGIGGLAIAKAIQALVPQETIHYIGDTQHLPYGDKGSKALRGYVAAVVDFCLKQGYKLLVIACNTATAAADDFLPAYFKTIAKELAIINVIDPVIRYIHNTNRYHQIGLIGTKYTVACGIYAKRLRTTGLTVLATPLLAPMVEAYFNGSTIDYLLLYQYLNQIAAPNLDALIPACTHYLFLDQALKRFLRASGLQGIEVINVARLTALAVQQWLMECNLFNHTGKRLPDCFMATAPTASFKNATQQLFASSSITINLSDASHNSIDI